MRLLRVALILLALSLLAACAQQPVREAASPRTRTTIDYAKYVQRTVPWFHLVSLYSWDSHSPGHVVVWTTPLRAYRLVLVGPCIGLQSAITIGLTSHGNLVQAPGDAVLVDRERCPIMRIEALDAKAIRAARSAAEQAAERKD